MLYSPPSFAKEFYEFAKQQNPRKRFVYMNADRCAVGQFLAYKKIPIDERGWDRWQLERYAVGARTFGQVAKRLRQALELGLL